MQTVNEYLSHVKDILSKHPIIVEEKVSFEVKTSSAGIVKEKLTFIGWKQIRIRRVHCNQRRKSEKGEV
jgi:hypothetical protein